METCNICGNHFCFCKHKKFVAKVEYVFEGKTEAECNKKLNEFYNSKSNIDLKGFSRATYPGSCHKNGYDQEVTRQIIDKFASLVLGYNYDEEQLARVIDTLSQEVDAAVEQDMIETAADMAYDRMRDEQAEASMGDLNGN